MLYLRFKGRYQREYDALFDFLVPQFGEADSVQGELVRAIRKLESDYYRNGSANFSNYRSLATLLRKKLRLKSLFDSVTLRQIEDDIETMREHGRGHNLDYNEGEDCYDRITDRVVEYCRARPQLMPLKSSQGQLKGSVAFIFQSANQCCCPCSE